MFLYMYATDSVCTLMTYKTQTSMAKKQSQTCLFDMYNMFPSAYKQPCLMFFSLRMFETRSNSTFLWDNTWFEIRQKLFSFMALYFTILNSTSSKSCIQLNCLDGRSTGFILFSSYSHQVTSIQKLQLMFNRKVGKQIFKKNLKNIQEEEVHLTGVFTKPVMDVMAQSTTF